MKNKGIIEAIKKIYNWMMEKEDCKTLCMDWQGRVVMIKILEYEELEEE